MDSTRGITSDHERGGDRTAQGLALSIFITHSFIIRSTACFTFNLRDKLSRDPEPAIADIAGQKRSEYRSSDGRGERTPAGPLQDCKFELCIAGALLSLALR